MKVYGILLLALVVVSIGSAKVLAKSGHGKKQVVHGTSSNKQSKSRLGQTRKKKGDKKRRSTTTKSKKNKGKKKRSNNNNNKTTKAASSAVLVTAAAADQANKTVR